MKLHPVLFSQKKEVVSILIFFSLSAYRLPPWFLLMAVGFIQNNKSLKVRRAMDSLKVILNRIDMQL